MENHLLELKNIEISYGDVKAVWDASLFVDKGSIVALVGANGAGKTSLLKAISGIIKASVGEILFEGTDITKMRPQKIVDMGISHVPEGRRLFSKLTVYENLRLGAYPSRARTDFDASLDRAYEMFPVLKDRTHQQAGSLSGGEQQMLAIARGLMSQPSILMLDEPSMGLSPIIVQTMFELIQTLNEQGVTILLVEQNVHQALKIADHAYVLKTGKIEMNGPGAELLTNPEVQQAYLGTRWRKK